MDILNIIKSRRSIRKYKKEKLKQEEILKIVEAGRWAPSASNNQPWRFILVQDEKIIEKIGDACKILIINDFVKNSPLIIVIYTEKKHRWVDIDCGMCAQNMMLEAYSLGIGSCFIGAFRERKIREVLNIPEDKNIIGLITFGYIDEEKEPPPRLSIEDLVKYEVYSKDKVISNLKRKFNLKSGILSLLGLFLKNQK